MDSRARHANEGPIRNIDTLGKLGPTIGTLFVGGMLFGNLSKLVGRTLQGFAATAGVAVRASAAAARSRRFQHGGFSVLICLFNVRSFRQSNF